MAYSAAEVKKITGAKTKSEALRLLYKGLEGRQWQGNGRAYGLAGYDPKKDRVHFTATWSAGPNTAGHSRVELSMQAAVENATGDLSDAVILH